MPGVSHMMGTERPFPGTGQRPADAQHGFWYHNNAHTQGTLSGSPGKRGPPPHEGMAAYGRHALWVETVPMAGLYGCTSTGLFRWPRNASSAPGNHHV